MAKWDKPKLLQEIETRHGHRCDAEKSIKKLTPPHLLATSSKKDFDAVYTKQREQFLEYSLMETYDMGVLLATLYIIATEYGSAYMVDLALSRAEARHKLDPDVEKALHEREAKEAEAREKAAKSDKKQGELDGQQKIGVEGGKLKVKDDGSEAEPASECVTKPLSEMEAEAQEDQVDPVEDTEPVAVSKDQEQTSEPEAVPEIVDNDPLGLAIEEAPAPEEVPPPAKAKATKVKETTKKPGSKKGTGNRKRISI